MIAHQLGSPRSGAAAEAAAGMPGWCVLAIGPLRELPKAEGRKDLSMGAPKPLRKEGKPGQAGRKAGVQTLGEARIMRVR